MCHLQGASLLFKSHNVKIQIALFYGEKLLFFFVCESYVADYFFVIFNLGFFAVQRSHCGSLMCGGDIEFVECK